MIKILSQENSILNQFLLELRDVELQKDRAKFRNNLKRIGSLMAYEISRSMSYKKVPVQTPMATTYNKKLANRPVVIGILRAALPFFNGFMEIFDDSDTGFVGAARREGEDISVDLDYLAISGIENKEVIIVDPMLATGKSLAAAIDKLLSYGTPSKVHLASVVAAPQGIDYISGYLKIDHAIWTIAVDKGLNDKHYIIPGLGDAGDLAFGSKI